MNIFKLSVKWIPDSVELENTKSDFRMIQKFENVPLKS